MTILTNLYAGNVRFEKKVLPLAVALAATLANPAIAQEAEPEKKGYSLVLEEVVVTAQKREESTMTVPISVDAFSAQDLVNTGATDIGQISDYIQVSK